MIRKLATLTLASAVSFAWVTMAQAQIKVPPGQEFDATPMSHADMTMMPSAKISMPAPAAKKHKMMKHKMAKHKMMKHKMKH